jgi:hypothetical protein
VENKNDDAMCPKQRVLVGVSYFFFDGSGCASEENHLEP